MALSKRSNKAPEMPDAAAFLRVLEEGLAAPEVVSAAYQQALREWSGGRRYEVTDLAKERPEPGDQTAESALIALHRVVMFNNHPKEEQ